MNKTSKQRAIALEKTAQKLEKKAAEIKDAERNTVVAGVLETCNDIKSILTEQNDGYKSLVTYLQYLENREDKNAAQSADISMDIAKGINNLLTSLDNKPDAATKNDIDKTIKNAIAKVENIFLQEGEVPESGDVRFDRDGKVRTVQEQYSNFSITTTFKHRRDGGFSWNTERVDG